MMLGTRIIGFFLILGTAQGAAPDQVVAVCRCGIEAYREALEGIRQSIGRRPEAIDLSAVDERALAARVSDPGKAYIAVGREALHALVRAKAAGPVIAAMMLHRDAAAEGAPLAAEIGLDVPPRAVFADLRRLFPGRRRLGILVSAGSEQEDLTASAREAAFSPVVVAVKGPPELLRAFVSLKGRVDMVLTLPDGELYNSATVKPLILASLEHRLPVIGFSAAFVRAGAAAGVFLDFREVGRRAGEAALSHEAGRGQKGADQPTKPKVAVNQRVLRLLGIDYQRSGDVETALE